MMHDSEIITAVVDTITSDGFELMDCKWTISTEELEGPADGSKPEPGAKYHKAGDEFTITIKLKRKS